MSFRQIFSLSLLLFLPLATFGQDEKPKFSPSAIYTDNEGDQQESTYVDKVDAPVDVMFVPNATNLDSHTPSYEWHFRKQGQVDDLFVRYTETTTHRFVDMGTYEIVLKVTLTDTGEQIDSTDIRTITVIISESSLVFPNAFSPNGDSYNEEFKAKECKNIVEFHAYIFNRWGQKLFDWTDPTKGWDGKYKGNDVKEGVYFLLVKAKGSDGRVYNIRRDVNLLRGNADGTKSQQ